MHVCSLKYDFCLLQAKKPLGEPFTVRETAGSERMKCPLHFPLKFSSPETVLVYFSFFKILKRFQGTNV